MFGCAAYAQQQNTASSNKEMTYKYEIYETKWSASGYKIISKDGKIIAEGENTRAINIYEVSNDTLILVLGAGLNMQTLKYFDLSQVGNELVSEFFNIVNSPWAEYLSINNEWLIAYYDFPDNGIVIRDIFNESGFYTKIQSINGQKLSDICENISFINDNEIFVTVEAYKTGYSEEDVMMGRPYELETLSEVLKFR